MGVFSPIRDAVAGDENSSEGRAANLTGIAAQMAKKRVSRKSSFTAAPRRAPLAYALRPPQETTIAEDIPGRMTGKENVPPGYETTGNKKGEKKKILGDSSNQPRIPRRPVSDYAKRPRPASNHPKSRSPKVKPSRKPDHKEGFPKLQAPARAARERDVNDDFARLCLSEEEEKMVLESRANEASRIPPQQFPAPRSDNSYANTTVPTLATALLTPQYPLMSGDIQDSSLYENNWLAYQEIAITQLVNNILDGSKRSADAAFDFSTQSRLLTTYQDQSFVFLQKRLQASLLYGTLALPKEMSTTSSRLTGDLGLKHNFLNLWLGTYNLQLLQACAEVVIGRKCTGGLKTSPSTQITASPPKKTASKQNLSRYLDMFLIRNEDYNPVRGMPDPGTTGLQHTLLRSLMLIKVLDTTKTSPDSPFSGCLFRPSSPYKSSTAVVQALAQMFHPAAGNIMRSLSHLSYTVSHVQDPLEEYNHHITNLAVDLRDGVRLTRLVEQLLFPSSPGQLSQQLHFPCLSRAAKLSNMQIALTAISESPALAQLATTIHASDLVDGFREKTVALLWGLTRKVGLPSLIDWHDLGRETIRLGGGHPSPDHNEVGHHHYEQQLRSWASATATRHGLPAPANLSTSFADGAVFAAIVDEYEPYLLVASESTSPPRQARRRRLSERLAALGCSKQFGE
jgi:abnormal spindle-like microcephaly-associated protein